MKAVAENEADLYRMVTDQHICPFGLKSRALLEREGYVVRDNLLRTRAQADSFMVKNAVKTTPQTFIAGQRIGGYDDLLKHFNYAIPDPDAVTYTPVLAVFGIAALMAISASWSASGVAITIRTGEWFIAFSMCMLAMLKLRDLESFSNVFLGYDLLAQRIVRYAYVYPFAEAVAGTLMIAGALKWLSIPIALFIGTIGAVSVVKAVYIDKRKLKCACVGGNSNVPLGFISLTENIMMVAIATWMLGNR